MSGFLQRLVARSQPAGDDLKEDEQTVRPRIGSRFEPVHRQDAVIEPALPDDDEREEDETALANQPEPRRVEYDDTPHQARTIVVLSPESPPASQDDTDDVVTPATDDAPDIDAALASIRALADDFRRQKPLTRSDSGRERDRPPPDPRPHVSERQPAASPDEGSAREASTPPERSDAPIEPHIERRQPQQPAPPTPEPEQASERSAATVTPAPDMSEVQRSSSAEREATSPSRRHDESRPPPVVPRPEPADSGRTEAPQRVVKHEQTVIRTQVAATPVEPPATEENQNVRSQPVAPTQRERFSTPDAEPTSSIRVQPQIMATPQPSGKRPGERRRTDESPTVRVSIGRIEVRAETPTPEMPVSQPSETVPRRQPAVSLSEYLKQRSGDRR